MSKKKELAKLTIERFAEMLSRDARPAREQVVAVKPLQRAIRFNKHERHQHFREWAGVGVKVGRELGLVRRDEGGPRIDVTDEIRQALRLDDEDTLAVTKRKDRLFLKKLVCEELPPVVPGAYALDSFGGRSVTRLCQAQPEFAAITDGCLAKLRRAAGKFRYDPVEPFREMDGMTGVIARNAFAGGLARADREWVRGYAQALSEEQEDDGSWQGKVPATAYNVTRLLDLGCEPDEPCIRKAVDWLLARPSPTGFPALYMSSDRDTEKFNQWKQPGTNKRRGRISPKVVKAQFQENADLHGAPGSYCEVRFVGTNGVVLEALLRCGLHEYERVVRAVNTALKMRRYSGWCGCGYLDTGPANFIEPDDGPPDFNRCPFSPTTGWCPDAEAVRKWAVRNNGVLEGIDVGEGRSLLSCTSGYTRDCTRAIFRGLSFHPEYRGSNLEIGGAFESIGSQSGYGVWPEYLSYMFSTLERCMHPLSTFALLRAVPFLIRTQERDGLWCESAGGATVLPGTGVCHALPKEQASLLILKALHTHGQLKDLLPSKARGGRRRGRGT